MAEAEDDRRRRGRRTILFIDEIHRFNKSQQDAFLPRVEAGDIVLIGATTENPSFEVNSALLSRSKVYVLKPLSDEAIGRIVTRAISDPERGLGAQRLSVDDDARAAIVRFANGDARIALNLLDLAAAGLGPDERITAALVADLAQNRALLRQDWRRALQPDLGAAQVDAEQRRGCLGLLAREDARGRRGSTLRRPSAGAVRVRGRWERRSPGAQRRGGGQGRRSFHRDA